ncbi:MAG: tRNA (adenosine(37)-N6)-dimethylallyltransferase MiaA [Thermodesulfobacteriota bacterium]
MPMNPDRPRLVIITGPTAVGKSGLGHGLAREMGGEIINADSMQIYRSMDIGTAKPAPAERREVLYHLIDIIHPDQPFDASEFRIRAQAVIQELHLRQVPIFVIGGTGLYLRVLQRGLFSCPKPKAEIREKWKKNSLVYGPQFLWETLRAQDPLSAARIHHRDTYRLIRALEVLELTGCPISDWQQWGQEGEPDYEILWIGLTLDRQVLYQRINQRAEKMIAQGFLEEVRGLLHLGYSPELKSMKSLGYRHLAKVLQGDLELPEALDLLKRDTRRYAKRQLTWLSGETNLNWFSPLEFDKIHSKVFEFLNRPRDYVHT